MILTTIIIYMPFLSINTHCQLMFNISHSIIKTKLSTFTTRPYLKWGVDSKI